MSGEGQFSSHGVRQSEFDLHFCSSQAFSGLDDAILFGEGHLFYSIGQFSC